MDLPEFREAVDRWLDDNAADLTPDLGPTATLDEQMAHLSLVKRRAFDAGRMRWGWPERVGGRGG